MIKYYANINSKSTNKNKLIPAHHLVYCLLGFAHLLGAEGDRLLRSFQLPYLREKEFDIGLGGVKPLI
jgi:hypothetical protein